MPLYKYDRPAGYVGTDPSVGGSSPFQLLSSSPREQVINPAGAITINLPTTGIMAGEAIIIRNRSANLVTIQSSGANDIYAVNTGFVRLVALQDAPTAAAHWHLADVDDYVSSTLNGSGSYTSGGAFNIYRKGNMVTIAVMTAAGHASASTATSAASLVAAKFCPSAEINNAHAINSSSVHVLRIFANGSIGSLYRDWAGTLVNQTSTIPGATASWYVA